MSPETKAQAQDKLAHFTVKIGYPDTVARLLRLADQAATISLGNAMRARRVPVRRL